MSGKGLGDRLLLIPPSSTLSSPSPTLDSSSPGLLGPSRNKSDTNEKNGHAWDRQPVLLLLLLLFFLTRLNEDTMWYGHTMTRCDATQSLELIRMGQCLCTDPSLSLHAILKQRPSDDQQKGSS